MLQTEKKKRKAHGPNQGIGFVAAQSRLIDINRFGARDVNIHEIASALAQINRFGGRGIYPYSVAQHSVAVASHITDPAWKPFALLHDSAEAYLGDICKPLKDMTALQYQGGMREFASVEREIRRHIFTAMNLTEPQDRDEMWTAIHTADIYETAREYDRLFPNHRGDVEYEPLAPVRDWEAARTLFLTMLAKALNV
jgi:hypothetical protein